MTELKQALEKIVFEDDARFAKRMDQDDPLAEFRSHFLFPLQENGEEVIYFAGNSLGLQPENARHYIAEELEDWAQHAVEGHWMARHPWLPYHENVTDSSARLVGARPAEVVVMNTLTVNLHLMMVSFYKATKERYKILVEGNAFPSDQYAVASQAKFHGFDPAEAVIELRPRSGESTLRTEDILEVIAKRGSEIALVLLGNVNYLTGQCFQIEPITKAAHDKGCMVGFNLAHGAGNLLLRLHDWNVDFAVWCSYKYLNSGPGSLAGCFIHQNHCRRKDLPRFEGWWGHNKETRFQMGPQFDPIPTAEAWQLSNPPIFQLAALRAAMELFDRATMPALRQKSESLTGYLEFLLQKRLAGKVEIITPLAREERGCQLSLTASGNPKEALKALQQRGAICDFREPNIIRAAPTPLYNSFSDVYKFVDLLSECLK